jgi:hypothetical protein
MRASGAVWNTKSSNLTESLDKMEPSVDNDAVSDVGRTDPSIVPPDWSFGSSPAGAGSLTIEKGQGPSGPRTPPFRHGPGIAAGRLSAVPGEPVVGDRRPTRMLHIPTLRVAWLHGFRESSMV